MPNPFGSYLGFGNIPFQPQYGSPGTRDYFGFWPNAWGAFYAPYVQQFGASPFAQFLGNQQGDLQRLFEAENAQRLAQGGNLESQMRPDEWLQGFSPLDYYLAHSPGQRGERSGNSPFTRWLRF